LGLGSGGRCTKAKNHTSKHLPERKLCTCLANPTTFFKVSPPHPGAGAAYHALFTAPCVYACIRVSVRACCVRGCIYLRMCLCQKEFYATHALLFVGRASTERYPPTISDTRDAHTDLYPLALSPTRQSSTWPRYTSSVASWTTTGIRCELVPRPARPCRGSCIMLRPPVLCRAVLLCVARYHCQRAHR